MREREVVVPDADMSSSESDTRRTNGRGRESTGFIAGMRNDEGGGIMARAGMDENVDVDADADVGGGT